MRNTLAIARKELTIYFTTPWAYMVFTAMAFISSFFFIGYLSEFKEVQLWARQMGWARLPSEYKNLTDGVVVQLWGAVLIITLFVAPFLSMRLFAEEKRQRTFELLMTAPVRPIEIVLGKYLGGVGAISATLGLTIVYPLILAAFGSSESGSTLEWSTVALGYLALLLWGATCMGIGMFISSLTESQMLAAVLNFAVLLPWWLLSFLTRSAEEPFRSIANHLSFGVQVQNLIKGVLDLKALVFFASLILFSILLTHRSVEAQRWT
ncbi:MAG: ABC transporter permease [Myxococcales bacterium]|nr:ABC transporter permease [Myxococcales bacterium]